MAATGGDTNRQNITIDHIPKDMPCSDLAENTSFHSDPGVDPMGIGRALSNMAKGGQTQGGSTITQQYVKNTYLSQEQTVTRKFKEIFISIKVGSKLSKDQILQGYLNTAYYGRDPYGIQAAAQTYYGENAKDLTPSSASSWRPSSRARRTTPIGATNIAPRELEGQHRSLEERWKWILDQRHDEKRITDAEYQTRSAVPKPKKLTATKA